MSKNTKEYEEYRKRFVRLVENQEEDLDVIIDKTINGFESVLKSSKSGNTIDEDKAIKGMKKVLLLWGVDSLSTMTKYNAETADLVGKQQKQLVTDTYNNNSITQQVKKSTGNLKSYMTKAFPARKWPTDGVSVGVRIKTIEKGSLKTAQDIIRTGINEGLSSKQLAESLENWIRPDLNKKWVSPYDWYRKRFSYKVKKVPTNRPIGSLKYNMTRIARTEINHTYRQSTILSHKNQRWIKGWNWNLSGSHPKVDICDEWAAGSPYKDHETVAGFGHPHCFCYITPELKTIKEL